VHSVLGKFVRVTLLTDMPVSSEISDEALKGLLLGHYREKVVAIVLCSCQTSGSYGHVSIVIPRPSRIYRPDQTAFEIAAGLPPSATSAGKMVA
jgi:hypothetical protein